MCGICGKIHFDRDEPASAAVVGNMMRVIAHRGPDGEGRFVSGPIALGHRRLSIIDLSTGDQPMSNEDGTVWVVFNGEIYNFAELRRRARRLGGTASSRRAIPKSSCTCTRKSATSASAASRACSHLRCGINAGSGCCLLAIGSASSRCTTPTRAVRWSSGPRSSLSLQTRRCSARSTLRAIDRFLTYYYAPGDLTLLRGIRKLEPGHYLTVEGGRVTTTRYWDLAFPAPRSSSLEESAQDLAGLLSETVKSHMISDVPVGVLLSGGWTRPGSCTSPLCMPRPRCTASR